MLISINVKMESVHGINNKHFFSFCVWIRLIWLNFSLRTKHVALCSILSKTEIVQLFASTLRDFFTNCFTLYCTTGARAPILGKLVWTMRFSCGFAYVYIGKPWFPCGFPLETWGFHMVSPYLPYGEATS